MDLSMPDKIQQWIGRYRFNKLKIGDEIKTFIDDDMDKKVWMRVQSKNDEDFTVTGPITSIHCGDVEIGDIVTVNGEWYLIKK